MICIAAETGEDEGDSERGGAWDWRYWVLGIGYWVLEEAISGMKTTFSSVPV
jgi:hypothetical protein